MAYRHRKEIRDRANAQRSNIVVSKVQRTKRVYHYNLTSTTQAEFDNLVKLNKNKEARIAVHPVRRSLSQLTPSNVLTVKGYFDVKGINLQRLRVSIYRYAKELNLHIETAFSKDKNALLVRLKRNWPVGVDIQVG